MKKSYVGVCAALLLLAVTAVGQKSSNSVTASAPVSGQDGRCVKVLASERYRPRSGQSTRPEPVKRATDLPFEAAGLNSASSVSRTCDASQASVPALKRWAIVRPSAPADYGSTSSPEKSTTAAAPQPDPDDDSWHFEISPYIWAAALKGDLRVNNTTANVDASFSDIFHNLDFSFATAAEAIKGKWRVLIDENYINLGTTGTGPLGETTDVQPTLNFFEVGASYAPVIIPNKDSTANEPLPPIFSLEALGGLRYTHFGLGLARAGNPGVEGSRNLVDFFGGGRLKIRPHPKFTLIEKFTLGGGGSNFAWTFTSLGDYRFRKCLSAWGGYQVLSMDADDPSNIIGFDGQLRGLIFGVTIHK